MYSWELIHLFNPPHLCACPKPGPGFPRTLFIVINFYFASWFNIRSGCSLCWYWWNCWPSLFNTKLQNYRFIVLNATFNNISVISWRSVLLVEEIGIPGENHRPVASHWQTLSHNVVSSILCDKRGSHSQT